MFIIKIVKDDNSYTCISCAAYEVAPCGGAMSIIAYPVLTSPGVEYHLTEDANGNEGRVAYIMNSEGKTIDRVGCTVLC